MINLDTEADFTWMFGEDFHLELSDGSSYLWSDPRYGGNNTIRPFPYPKEEMGIRQEKLDPSLPWGRDKGVHVIREYCGENVIFVK